MDTIKYFIIYTELGRHGFLDSSKPKVQCHHLHGTDGKTGPLREGGLNTGLETGMEQYPNEEPVQPCS